MILLPFILRLSILSFTRFSRLRLHVFEKIFKIAIVIITESLKAGFSYASQEKAPGIFGVPATIDARNQLNVIFGFHGAGKDQVFVLLRFQGKITLQIAILIIIFDPDGLLFFEIHCADENIERAVGICFYLREFTIFIQ